MTLEDFDTLRIGSKVFLDGMKHIALRFNRVDKKVKIDDGTWVDYRNLDYRKVVKHRVIRKICVEFPNGYKMIFDDAVQTSKFLGFTPTGAYLAARDESTSHVKVKIRFKKTDD